MSGSRQTNTLIGPKTPREMETTDSPTGNKTPVGRAVQGLTPSRSKTPLKALVHSPGLDLLSPNDDETERARARARRAMAHRRQSFGPEVERVDTGSLASGEDTNILSYDSLTAMLQNCLKLSAANKINQGNTWDLKLIDHLSDLVRNDTDDETQTNFQLASCTLETGVKIYSYRVDSVHSEAYRLLGGLGRAALEDVRNELHVENGNGDGSNPPTTGTTNKKVGVTLESSFEALNKKVDVAFNPDPLFYQTSALFDEGGAQGLLLNNLSVYCGCEIVFDSLEVPEIKMKAEAAALEGSDVLDLSFMKDSIQGMLDVLGHEPEITPTLKEIVQLLDDPYRAAAEAEVVQCGQANRTDLFTPSRSRCDAGDFEGEEDDDPGEILYQGDDGLDEMDTRSFNGTSPDSTTWSETAEGQDQEDIDLGEDRHGEIFMSQDPMEWLTIAGGMLVKSNAWAGPDHWKYTKPKEEPQVSQTVNQGKDKTMRKKKESFSIDFESLPEIDLCAFQPPKNPRISLMPQSISPSSTLLPEDFHYEAIFRKRSKKKSAQMSSVGDFQDMCDEVRWDNDDNEPAGEWGDGTGNSDVEDLVAYNLVPEPRKVQQIHVRYDKHAKQVDVRLLKETLWEQLHHSFPGNDQEEDWDKESGLSFQQVLKRFPEDCPAAVPEDISVQLCFICLLHLANEHCLRIDDCSTMDDLRIFRVHDDSDVFSS